MKYVWVVTLAGYTATEAYTTEEAANKARESLEKKHPCSDYYVDKVELRDKHRPRR